jgi:aminoglycoside phosphotransferase (APT) family kinase protein
VWIHGDLQAANLLVEHGRLVAVIDFGGIGLGDPAVDVMPAWSVFDAGPRARFREALGGDEDTGRRGRGWALATALIALSYHWDSFPAMVEESQRKIDEVLAS